MKQHAELLQQQYQRKYTDSKIDWFIVNFFAFDVPYKTFLHKRYVSKAGTLL